MAVCRNCKKEVNANANICPYCGTRMPGNQTIADLKGFLIGWVIILCVLCGIAYWFCDLFGLN